MSPAIDETRLLPRDAAMACVAFVSAPSCPIRAARRAIWVATVCAMFGLFVAAPAHASARWLAPLDLSVTGHSPMGTRVVVNPQGDAAAVWERFDGADLVVEAAVRPAGDSWRPPVVLGLAGHAPADPQIAVEPRIAIDPLGNAAAVWRGIAGVQAATADAADGRWNVTVDLSGAGASDPRVAIDAQGNAVAVWERGFVVQTSVRPAGGGWQAPIDLASDAQGPELSVNPHGDAVVVWQASTNLLPGAQIVQGAVRSAGGSWQATTNISGPFYDGFDFHVAIAADGTAIAVWRRGTTINTNVQGAVRPPGGPWQAPVDIAATVQDTSDLELAVDPQSNATAIWRGHDPTTTDNVIQSATRPAGGTWQPAIDLSAPGADGQVPQVAVADNGEAVAIWQAQANTVVQGAVRPAGGAWHAPVDISAAGQTATAGPVAIAPNGDAILLLQRLDGATQVTQGALRPGGEIWQAPIDVSTPGASAAYSDVGVDAQGNAVAVWTRSGAGAHTVQSVGYDPAGPRLRGLSVPPAGVAGQPISASVTPFDMWSALATTSWTFGDGTTTTGTAVSHTYANAGRFSIGVVAADALGNVTGAMRDITIAPAPTPAPPPAPALLPRISGLRLSPRTFQPIPTAATVRAGARAASRVSYDLNVPARVRFTVERIAAGRKLGASCQAETARNRFRPSCRRSVAVPGSFTRIRRAGPDRFTFTGRMAGRALRPGRYRLVATPRADAIGGAPTRARFRIARQPRRSTTVPG